VYFSVFYLPVSLSVDVFCMDPCGLIQVNNNNNNNNNNNYSSTIHHKLRNSHEASSSYRFQLPLKYTPWSKKNKTPNYCPYLHQILTDFQNSFTDTLSRKFAIKMSLQIPPHLNGVATLPCELLVYKNCIKQLLKLNDVIFIRFINKRAIRISCAEKFTG